MSFLQVIKNWLSDIKHNQRIAFTIVSIDRSFLQNHHNDLHWYIEDTFDQGKFPTDLILIWMEGKDQEKIFVLYDDRETDLNKIAEILKDFGIKVKI